MIFYFYQVPCSFVQFQVFDRGCFHWRNGLLAEHREHSDLCQDFFRSCQDDHVRSKQIWPHKNIEKQNNLTKTIWSASPETSIITKMVFSEKFQWNRFIFNLQRYTVNKYSFNSPSQISIQYRISNIWFIECFHWFRSASISHVALKKPWKHDHDLIT